MQAEVSACANEIVESILNNLQDRRGIGGAFDMVDDDIMEEINSELTLIAEERIQSMFNKLPF